MEQTRKQQIKWAIVVACLLAAAIVFWATRPPARGPKSLKRGTMILAMCTNSECQAQYETDQRDFYIEVQEIMKVSPTLGTPAIACGKCGSQSLNRAVKCDKCEHVFLHGKVNDFDDRCPKCAYSKTEHTRQVDRSGR